MWSLEHLPKRTVRLLDEQGGELGTLHQPSLWNYHAEIVTPAGKCQVKNRSSWSTALVATMNDLPVWEIRFRWNGVQLCRPGSKEAMYTVARPSIWQERYRVSDVADRTVMVIDVRFSWRKFERVYNLNEVDTRSCPPMEVLLVVHALQVRYRRHAAA